MGLAVVLAGLVRHLRRPVSPRRVAFLVLGAVLVGSGSLAARPCWAADLTLTNQVRYHNASVHVDLEGVALSRAVAEVYRTALSPRSVVLATGTDLDDSVRLSLVFTGRPDDLVAALRVLLESHGYSLETTAWGVDVISAGRVRVRPGAPPAQAPLVPEVGL